MPQPPPHIWAHPRDWSLQPLYLSTLYYNHCTLLQIYKSGDYVAPMPHHLKVPPPLTPLHALPPPSPLATLAHTGSNVLGSGHQLWCQNPTTGHRRRDVPPLPWSTPNLTIVIAHLVRALLPLLLPHPARAPNWKTRVRGPLLPIPLLPCVHLPPPFLLPPPLSGRNRRASS